MVFTFEVKQEPSVDSLVTNVSKAMDKAWPVVCGDVQDQVRNRIRNVLEAKILDWEVPGDLLLDYPFLVNLRSLIDNYVSCINIDITVGSEYGITVYVDENRLESLGLPLNLYDLLEFGNEDLPNFTHMNKGINDWLRMDGGEFFKKLNDEIVKLAFK